jgi:hypothetical protein
MSRVDKAANQISADTPQDMLERVFAVAELVAKSKEQQVKPSSCSQKSSEKHRKENLVYCVDESIICQRTG